MSTTLYNNACAPAHAKAEANSSMTNRSRENRLSLLPEHSNIVYTRCLDKLALCQLSSRCSRVFYIILNQTVGRSKREDNINSIRLEKLTEIRHDHAAQAMKDLIAMKIIIHRSGGKYRNWLSINFNFEMWGNLSIAEQHKSNNPELLLPTKYTETPADNGLVLDPTKLQNIPPPSTETTPLNPLESTEDTVCNMSTETKAVSSENNETSQAIETNNITAKQTKNIVADTQENTQTVESIETSNNLEKQVESTVNNSNKTEKLMERSVIDKHAVQKIETKLTTLFSKKLSSALETINQTLQGFEKHLSTTVSTQVPVVSAKETTKKLDIPQLIEPITAQNSACQNEIQIHQNNDENNDQEIQDVVVSSNHYVIEIAPFNYPEELDTEQCQALQGLLIKSGDRAQDLLTLLAQRLKNTHNPVVDPASYFATLVYKYQRNKVDFSVLSAIKPMKSTQEKAQDAYLDELKSHYQLCHSDYLHFQKIIEGEMKHKEKTFKQVCESGHLGGIIENCTHKLQQAKFALDDFLAGDELIPA